MNDKVALGLLGTGAVLLSTLIGSCVYDCATSTVQLVEVTIIDKNYVPGHYDRVCTVENVGSIENPVSVPVCHDEWNPPTWSATYEDGVERYTTSVTSGMYDQLRLGDRRWLSYYRGGYWGIRYAGQFLMTKPSAESK